MTRIASCGSMKQRGMCVSLSSPPKGTGRSHRREAVGQIDGLNCSEHWNTGGVSRALLRPSLPDQVFPRLVSDVLAGRYAPGERLPTQRALAAELGVNMASVREGVKRLEQLGLVEVRHGDAMRVLDWRLHGGPDVLVHLIAHAGALDNEMVRSVMEARRLLLSESARLAATRRGHEQGARVG